MLEHTAGIPEAKIVAAHGTYKTSRCIKCEKQYSFDWALSNINF